MPARQRLRSRLAAAIAALAIGVVLVHSVAVYFFSEQREERQINELVAEEMEELRMRFRADRRYIPPQTAAYRHYVVRSAAERAAVPAAFRDLPAGVHEVHDGGQEYHVEVREQDGARLFVVYDSSSHEEKVIQLFWVLLLGTAVAGVAAAALGYFLSAHLTQPLYDLAQRVQSLGPGAVPAPLAGRYRDEEVVRLAQAFDDFLARLNSYIEREQQFAGSVSHELRTPLTQIATGCELLLGEPGIEPGARVRVERIQRSVQWMTTLTQSLLLLARSGTAAPRETMALRECVEEVGEGLRDLFAGKANRLRNTVAGGVIIEANRAALATVLANLLRNACESTESGEVRVWGDAGELVIEDTGRGIAPEDLPRVFERHFRGRSGSPGGSGLGLAIVRQICDQHRWAVTLSSEPGQGTRVALRLTGG